MVKYSDANDHRMNWSRKCCKMGIFTTLVCRAGTYHPLLDHVKNFGLMVPLYLSCGDATLCMRTQESEIKSYLSHDLYKDFVLVPISHAGRYVGKSCKEQQSCNAVQLRKVTPFAKLGRKQIIMKLCMYVLSGDTLSAPSLKWLCLNIRKTCGKRTRKER